MRAQAYTLEGVFAAVIVLTALLYGIQTVDVGPWTSDTSEQTNELKLRAQDTLDIAANNGTLNRMVRCYGVSGKTVFDGNTAGSNATTFERLLNQTFDRQGRDYNLYIRYWNGSAGQESVVASSRDHDSGDDVGLIAPSESATVATRTVTVFDDQYTLIHADSDDPCAKQYQRVKTYQETTEAFYMPDIAPDSRLYNIVEVRLVVW